MSSYQSEPDYQVYGDKNYFAHNIKGATSEEDRRFFAMRIAAYGVIDFGSIKTTEIKEISLLDVGIKSPISIVSVYAFVDDGKSIDDEINFILRRGNEHVGKLNLRFNVMPFAFPPGAVVTPDLTIAIDSHRAMSSVLVYWQPVHILHSAQV